MEENEMEMYKRAYKELYVILTHTDGEVTTKIPEKFMELVKMKMSEEYDFKIDESKQLSDQILLDETRHLLSIVRKNYLNPEVAKEVTQAIEEVIEEEKASNEVKIDKPQIVEDVPDVKTIEAIMDDTAEKKLLVEEIGEASQELIVVKPKNIFVRLFEKLKSIFIRNKEKQIENNEIM